MSEVNFESVTDTQLLAEIHRRGLDTRQTIDQPPLDATVTSDEQVLLKPIFASGDDPGEFVHKVAPSHWTSELKQRVLDKALRMEVDPDARPDIFGMLVWAIINDYEGRIATYRWLDTIGKKSSRADFSKPA